MSVDRLAVRLREVVAALDQVRQTIGAARTWVDEAAGALATAAAGSRDGDLAQAVTSLGAAKDELLLPYESVGNVRHTIGRYLADVAEDGSVPSVTVRPREAGEVRRQRRDSKTRSPGGVANRHGDRYPHDSLPYSDDLPPRVIRGAGNSPTIGIIEIGGRMYGEMRPTRDDVWHRDVIDRIDAIGLSRRAKRHANHVEMKAAIMVIASPGRHGRVILNHAPCGSERGAFEGCETFLAELLPEGSSLTVLGTDAQGNPFTRIYHGKASQ